MKDTRYLKGTLTDDNARRDLIVDDGRLNHGFVIKSFTMWPARSSQIVDVSAVLATKNSGATLPMVARDNRQVAWCYLSSQTAMGGGGFTSIILPDEIVLEELQIIADWAGGGFADGLNYLIELCPITMSDSQAALVLINNKSQDLAN